MSHNPPASNPSSPQASRSTPSEDEQTAGTDDELEKGLSVPPHRAIEQETVFRWRAGGDTPLTLSHIKGYPNIRESLRQLVVDPLKSNHNLYERFKVGPPNLLFKGTHGTGKTHAAKCLVGAMNAPYVSLSPTELMSHYVNRSGRLINRLFHEADVLADKFGYSIIFADEIDALLPSRSDGKLHEENTKVVNQFLTELESTNDRGIIFIAATNCPENLDDAAIRDGRIDETLTFELPTPQGRFEILRYHLSDRPHKVPDGELQDLAKMLGEIRPAQIKTLVEDTAREAAYRQARYIRFDHLLEQINSL